MRRLWFRSRRAADVDEEIRSHLAESARGRMAVGVTREDAEREAQLEFGNVTRIREATREVWTWASLDRLRHDARDAVRSVRRSPMVAVAAVLSLALGIGANTGIFRVTNALMFRSLPVASPDGLYVLTLAAQPDGEWGAWPYTWYEKFRDRTEGLTGTAASAITHRPFVVVEGPNGGAREPDRITVDMVSGNYFSTLGLVPELGRLIGPADDVPEAGNAVMVISDTYWTSRFARAVDVVGRRISIGSASFTIVGVAPRGFTGDVVGDDTRLWVPIGQQSAVVPELPGQLTGDWQTGWAWVRILTRLQPGVTPERASAAASATLTAFEREHFPNSKKPDTRPLAVRPGAGGESPGRQTLAEPILILTAAVSLVLLIACANVANLLIARGLAREREFAVRTALGAGALRLVRQLLLESLLLSSAGTLLGVAVSSWVTAALVTLVASGDAHFALDTDLDRQVLAFAAVLALVTGGVFGLLPAWRATRVRAGLLADSRQSTLAAASHRHSGAGRSTRALVIAQVAMSVALLVGARLFSESLSGLRAHDLGIDRQHLLLVWTGGSSAPGSSATTIQRYRLAQERLSALPGVLSASPAMDGLLNDRSYSNPSEDLAVDGEQARPGLRWVNSTISPGYFRTLGAPLLAGREFTPSDSAGTRRVVVLGDTLARFLFGSANPIGRHLHDNCRSCVTEEVVGVVRDFVYASPRQGPLGIVYGNYQQMRFRSDSPMFVAIRTAGEPDAQAASVRQAIQAFAPEVPVLRMETVEARLYAMLSTDRMLALLSGAFSALALVLAGLGLYGVISYGVIRRTSEIGVRMVLGATRLRIAGMVMRQHVALVGLGLLLGAFLARAAARAIASRLYGVDPQDPSAYAGAMAILVAVGMVAALVPARRASRLDPAQTLRQD
jgi:predicted permease